MCERSLSPTRKDILDLYDQNRTTREVVTQLLISELWARRVQQQRAEQGKAKNAITRKRSTLWTSLVPQIQQGLANQPDLTLQELKSQRGTELHESTLCRALKRLKLTLKKKS